MCVCVCLFVCLFVWLGACLCECLCARLPVCVHDVGMFDCMFVCLLVFFSSNFYDVPIMILYCFMYASFVFKLCSYGVSMVCLYCLSCFLF